MARTDIPVEPNINVRLDGLHLAIPDRKTIAEEDPYDPFCAVLELLAAQLNASVGGSTRNGATVAAITDICTLFVTDAANHSFQGVDASTLHAMIDKLADCTYGEVLGEMQLGYVYGLDKTDVMRLRQGLANSPRKGVAETLSDIDFVYYGLYPNFVRLEQIREHRPDVLTTVKGWIQSVKPIVNSELLIGRADASGLHGEARFLRYCYIRYLANLRFFESPLGGGLKAAAPAAHKAFPLVLKDAAEYSRRELGRRVEQMRIVVAASRPTCPDCQELLTSLRMAHNTRGYLRELSSPQWLNPFTMARKDGLFAPGRYLLAAPVAKALAERHKGQATDGGVWTSVGN